MLSNLSHFKNSNLKVRIALFLVAFITIYLFSILFSYNYSDPTWFRTSAENIDIKNIGGIFGSYFSDFLLQFFGFSAYLLPFFISCFFGSFIYNFLNVNFKFSFLSFLLKSIAFLLCLLSLSMFFGLFIESDFEYPVGGILGETIIEQIESQFGVISVLLATFFIFVASFLFVFGKIANQICEVFGQILVYLVFSPFIFIKKMFIKKISLNALNKKNTKSNDFNFYEKEENGSYFSLENEKSSNSNKAKNETEILNEFTEKNEETKRFDFSAISPIAEAEKTQTENNNILLKNNFNNKENFFFSVKKTNDFLKFFDITNDLFVNKIEFFEDVTANKLLELTELNEINTHNDEVETIELEQAKRFSLRLKEKAMQENNHLESFYKEKNHQILENEIEFEKNKLDFSDENSQAKQNSFKNNEKLQEISEKTTQENGNWLHPFLNRDFVEQKKPTTPLPSATLLSKSLVLYEKINKENLMKTAELIEQCLLDYRITAKVVSISPGPVITLYELELAPGIKAARLTVLAKDLARALSLPSVRIVEVIPNKPYVGIELPNQKRQIVNFRELIESNEFRNAQSPLTLILGKDISGKTVVADLAKMPHLLVAGTTGSGKSVGINAMVLSILFKAKPENVRFIMIDPKMLELSVYEGIPHLLTPVVTDMKDAANALNWCINEMERRYRLMSALGVRNVAGYNEKIDLAAEMNHPIPDPFWIPKDHLDRSHPVLEKLPYIVVIVDEFADLIMSVGKKIEELIARLAQKARAAGIHLILATQRPSVDVITGLIKANIPTRIAFTVSSKIDSRTILDQMGAESLLGMGDMLYLPPNSSSVERVHGAFVKDEDVHAVAQDWKSRGRPNYLDEITNQQELHYNQENLSETDPLFDEAVEFVIEKKRASISGIQRQFRIGYNRAARIVEEMESQGIVSEPSGNGTRDVLVQN